MLTYVAPQHNDTGKKGLLGLLHSLQNKSLSRVGKYHFSGRYFPDNSRQIEILPYFHFKVQEICALPRLIEVKLHIKQSA